MKKSLSNLENSLEDVTALLELTQLQISSSQKSAILRSAVVLIIASWEQFVEQLAEASVSVLTSRLRDASTIPEEVKQSISSALVKESKPNLREFSQSVWQFSDKGWKTAYIESADPKPEA